MKDHIKQRNYFKKIDFPLKRKKPYDLQYKNYLFKSLFDIKSECYE